MRSLSLVPENASQVQPSQVNRPWTCEELAIHYRQFHKSGRRKGKPNVKWVQTRVRRGDFLVIPTGSRVQLFDPNDHLARTRGDLRSLKTELVNFDKYSSRPASRVTRRKARLKI